MYKRKTSLFILTIVFMLTIAPKTFAGKEMDEAKWSYAEETGPAYWGRLSKGYKLCSMGRNQSPVDIETADIKIDSKLPPLKFAYKSSVLNMINNGHAIQFNFSSGSKMIFENKEYNLLQLHFHAPSEHTINGKRANIEVHFVHENKEGHLVVVALMINKGKMNYALNNIFNNIPDLINSSRFIEDKKINPLAFFPSKGGYYTYSGSLTAPPCTENVTWIVFSEPIQASLEQIMKLTRVYRMNNRPVQPLNERKILRKP